MPQITRRAGACLALAAAVLLAGCGQERKRENEQLTAQVVALQQENVSLRGEVTSLKADTEALKKQIEQLVQEKQDLEEQLKEAEARAAAKPGTKPPLRPRRSGQEASPGTARGPSERP